MIILCADDYGLSEGVSDAIDDLATTGRLSATSALVTFDEWPQFAGRLVGLRRHIATGVHLNLTLGKPLGPMPALAESGTLPTLGRLIRTCCTGRVDKIEVRDELIRQFRRFEQSTGQRPDHIDGHQHVHALPVVRHALLEAIESVGWTHRPLVRSTEERIVTLLRRGVAVRKALTIAALTRGFRQQLAAAGLPTNDTFAGVSDFERGTSYAGELDAAFKYPGRRHLVMCHPGHPDATLRARDPVRERRAEEWTALQTIEGLPASIWHPRRGPDDSPIDWSAQPEVHS